MRLPAQIIPIKREENTGEENEEDLTLELGQEGGQDLPGTVKQRGQIWGGHRERRDRVGGEGVQPGTAPDQT